MLLENILSRFDRVLNDLGHDGRKVVAAKNVVRTLFADLDLRQPRKFEGVELTAHVTATLDLLGLDRPLALGCEDGDTITIKSFRACIETQLYNKVSGPLGIRATQQIDDLCRLFAQHLGLDPKATPDSTVLGRLIHERLQQVLLGIRLLAVGVIRNDDDVIAKADLLLELLPLVTVTEWNAGQGAWEIMKVG